MTVSLNMLLRIRRKLTVTVMLLFVAEIILFAAACYIHRQLDLYRVQLGSGMAKVKELTAVAQQTGSIKQLCFKNSKQAVAVLEDMCAGNNVSCKNISAIERSNDMNYRLSGNSDYEAFVTFLTELRKSHYLLKLNSFAMSFTGSNRLDYMLEVQAMRSPKEK